MLLIYIARHATPNWDIKDIPYHIPPGPPLTQTGLAEAEALGAFLSSVNVRRIYTSPLERCLNTAQIASCITGAPYEVWNGLMEAQPDETEESLHARAWPVFETACRESQQMGAVCLVAHGAQATRFLKDLGMDDETYKAYCDRFDHANPIPPAGAWRVTQEESDQPWKLELVFLPPKIPVVDNGTV